MDAPSHARVAIIGTGFAGIGMAVGLKRSGIDDFVLLERAGDVGGTWRDNSYPGCQCDVPSHLYSFSFAPNPGWSRTYSPQPEIFDYLRDCADRFGVRPHVRFGHEVCDATWDEDEQRWRLETTKGVLTADVLVAANGPLSEPSVPPIPGRERFRGTSFHSASWDHDHDLAGRRVAIIGTGASAIQIVPRIQPHVDALTVFQRTPAWVLPHTDRPTTRLERRLYARLPVLQRLVRAGIYATRELVVVGLAKDPRFVKPIRRLAESHLRRHVEDPELRAKLTPQYSPGCKRLLLSDDYYPALTAGNVDVVTDPITEIREHSVVTADGAEHEVDTIVYATGFHVTDNPMADRVHGAGGRSMADAWAADGARAYKGTTVTGFPNLFLLAGPNTGIGHTSLVVMIEAQVRYVLDALGWLEREGVAAVDVRADALDAFDREVQRKMKRTVWNAGGCASWYLDERGRNSTLWPDFTWRFRRLLRRFDAERYDVVPAARQPAQPASEAVGV